MPRYEVGKPPGVCSLTLPSSADTFDTADTTTLLRSRGRLLAASHAGARAELAPCATPQRLFRSAPAVQRAQRPAPLTRSICRTPRAQQSAGRPPASAEELPTSSKSRLSAATSLLLAALFGLTHVSQKAKQVQTDVSNRAASSNDVVVGRATLTKQLCQDLPPWLRFCLAASPWRALRRRARLGVVPPALRCACRRPQSAVSRPGPPCPRASPARSSCAVLGLSCGACFAHAIGCGPFGLRVRVRAREP